MIIHSHGRIHDFQIEGAQNINVHAAHIFRPWSVMSFAAGVQGPPKGPGSSRVLEALSWYLSLILTHSDTKLDLRKHSRSKLEAARACCAPLWIRHCIRYFSAIYRVPPKKTEQSDFLGLCADQHLSFYTLLYRASFPHYNNTKIIKFGWELFILWLISYGLSFSGFAIVINRASELWKSGKSRKWQSIRNYS